MSQVRAKLRQRIVNLAIANGTLFEQARELASRNEALEATVRELSQSLHAAQQRVRELDATARQALLDLASKLRTEQTERLSGCKIVPHKPLPEAWSGRA